MRSAATASMSSGTRTTLSLSENSVCSRRCTNADVIASPMPSIETDECGRFAELHAGGQAPEWQFAREPAAQRVEAAAMNGRGTQARQRHQVRARPVTEMRRQAIAG